MANYNVHHVQFIQGRFIIKIKVLHPETLKLTITLFNKSDENEMTLIELAVY